MAIKPLVAGNWKMNGMTSTIPEFDKLRAGWRETQAQSVDLMICPPATLLTALAVRRGAVLIGAQDCHPLEKGAHTGDIAAEMLVDAGASAIIVGHSERRADHAETDAMVRAKALAAMRAGAIAIVCVGETRLEREAGAALRVVLAQLAASVPDSAAASSVIIAYEPVWAIGTGLIPTIADVAEIHGAIRAALISRFGGEGVAIRILYGGSVKADNAASLMAVGDVNGALVGGASLKAGDFLAIAAVYNP